MEKTSDKIATKQKRLYALIVAGLILVGVVVIFFLNKDDEQVPKNAPRSSQFDTISKEIKPEDIRLSTLENFSDVLSGRMQSLEKSILDVKEEKALIEGEKDILAQETAELRGKIKALQEDLVTKTFYPTEVEQGIPIEEWQDREPPLKIWEATDKKEAKNVLFEIPSRDSREGCTCFRG